MCQILEDKMAIYFQEPGHAGNSWFYKNSLIDNYARNNSSYWVIYELLPMLVRFYHSYDWGTEAVDIHGWAVPYLVATAWTTAGPEYFAKLLFF